MIFYEVFISSNSKPGEILKRFIQLTDRIEVWLRKPTAFYRVGVAFLVFNQEYRTSDLYQADGIQKAYAIALESGVPVPYAMCSTHVSRHAKHLPGK